MMGRWLLAILIWWSLPSLAGELRPFQHGSWQTVREEHKGQPMIVHFWGLTCAPCLVELPAWGALAREHPELALVIVDADPMPIPPDMLNTALDKAGLSRTENWTFDITSERLRWEIDPNWQGELPMTVMVTSDGTTQTRMGTADMAAIRTWLKAQPSH